MHEGYGGASQAEKAGPRACACCHPDEASAAAVERSTVDKQSEDVLFVSEIFELGCGVGQISSQ